MEDQREYSFIVGHFLSASTTNPSTWYINNGASRQMASAHDMFIEITETRLDLELVLGDHTCVRAIGHGTASF